MYNRRESMRVKEIFLNKNKTGDIQGTAQQGVMYHTVTISRQKEYEDSNHSQQKE